MHVGFHSIRNHNERAVFAAVKKTAAGLPEVAGDEELLADIACVALNRLQPRYIRHEVDFSFYQNDTERLKSERELGAAVEFAFGYVQARTAIRPRG